MSEQLDLDLLPPAYPSVRTKQLTMTRTTPRPKKNTKGGPPPCRYSVCEQDGQEVGSIWDPGKGSVQWYTRQGAGRARNRHAALEEIKSLLGGGGGSDEGA